MYPRIPWYRRHGRIDRVRFRQILGELGVSCRHFAAECHIPNWSARFSFHVWPLPSVAACLREYEFTQALLDYVANPRKPELRWGFKPHFDPKGTDLSDKEVRAWQRAEAAKCIDELRAADPERDGNAAAVRMFIEANTKLHVHTQSSDYSGSFDSPFGGPRDRWPWYRSTLAQIRAWPNKIWQRWLWL
jgi:hypothetical protein